MSQWTVLDEEQRTTEERELQRALIEAGVNPGTKGFQRALGEAEQRGRQKADRAQDAAQKSENGAVYYTRKAARGVLAIIAVGFVLAVIIAGMTGGVGLLIWAEFEAVRKGFGVVDETLAGLYAGASVGMFISLSLVQLLIADNEGMSREEVFSLRMLRSWWRYFWGKSQEVRYQDAGLYRGAQTARQWLMWTIVMFGVLGRLRDIIETTETLHSAAWYDGLHYLLTQSNLETMTGTVGTLVMTVGLLTGTHFVVYFMYHLFRSVTGGVSLNFTSAVLSSEEYIWREQRRVYQIALDRARQNRVTTQEAPALPTTHASYPSNNGSSTHSLSNSDDRQTSLTGFSK